MDVERIWEMVFRDSKVKLKIMKLLRKQNGITITQIQRELTKKGDKYNYRTIWQHIANLEKGKFVVLKKQEHEAGKPVKVYLSKAFSDNYVWKVEAQ